MSAAQRPAGREVWAALVLTLAAVGIVTWWVLRPSPADLERARWRSCVDAAESLGFDPPGGAEAWCVTTTREGR